MNKNFASVVDTIQDKLESFIPIFEQVRLLHVPLPDVEIFEHGGEEVVNLPGHVQDVRHPVGRQLLQVGGVPLGAEIEEVKYLGGRVHLTEYKENLLVNERLEFFEVLIEIIFELLADTF